jgi:WXXGXW repeat (2 copies)
VKRVLPVLLGTLLVAFGANARGDDSDQKYIEVDARGPVHEAFAQPYEADPEPPKAVDKQPPEPIPEEPAAEKPAGKNVQWVPGYWQWDNDRKDFIWVAGMWRDMPQGRRWVAGYWAKTAEGYRWVSGHFADANEKDNQYVPQPPANPDEGPTTPAPDANSSYIPGAWFYGDNGYYYRSGYWTDCYADRVWIPARYYWSPYGYVFSSGYWDYPLFGRGLLFAPVYFTRPLWLTAGWYYRPFFSVGFGGLFGNFFVGFGYNHYFFGDYYARSYLGLGIYPWYWGSRYHYDPIWNHQRWVNRNNSNWASTFHNNYVGRVNGTLTTPPRTLAAQTTATAGTTRMLNSFAEARQSGLKLETVSQQQRTAQMQSARQIVNQSQQLSRGAPRVSAATSVSNYGHISSGGVFPGGGHTSGVFPGGGHTGGVFPGGGANAGGIQLGTGAAHGNGRPTFTNPGGGRPSGGMTMPGSGGSFGGGRPSGGGNFGGGRPSGGGSFGGGSHGGGGGGGGHHR